MAGFCSAHREYNPECSTCVQSLVIEVATLQAERDDLRAQVASLSAERDRMKAAMEKVVHYTRPEPDFDTWVAARTAFNIASRVLGRPAVIIREHSPLAPSRTRRLATKTGAMT